ncbi:MAG: hypothetical protein HKN87_03455, partial [Saprospiraceae bacterium]|nr:hypothetical protein [Saprospiraceae bacterium]
MTRKTFNFCCLVVFVLVSTEYLQGQCGLPDPLSIRDLNTTAAHIRVENLPSSILGAGGQGVCQIRVRFRHESIGDVSLLLISPNGRSFPLIVPSGSRPTNGTVWDITFVPCAQTAVPDEGNFIKPQWDSDQAWGTDQNYRGSYHPITCLEEINNGPANGLWTITVADITGSGSGVIESFDISFCNSSGL